MWLSGSGVVARVRVVVREEWCGCQVRRESAPYCSRFFKALVIEASLLPVRVPSIASSNA